MILLSSLQFYITPTFITVIDTNKVYFNSNNNKIKIIDDQLKTIKWMFMSIRLL